jgi:membrane protein YqaA with SNARE-associated domain
MGKVRFTCMTAIVAAPATSARYTARQTQPGRSMNTTHLHAVVQKKAYALSFGWGVIEAMLFFLVPDVIISVVAIQSFRRSLWSSAWAVAGGMVGGSVMYAWGAWDASTALAVVDAIPAIPSEMIETVHQSLSAKGLVAMVWGPVVGIPYKIYAVQAGALGLSWPMFLVMTIPARIIRFVITCVAFNLLARPVRRYLGTKAIPWCWIGFWILNYTIYWHAHMRF